LSSQSNQAGAVMAREFDQMPLFSEFSAAYSAPLPAPTGFAVLADGEKSS
jgi:hypothetical protein